MSTAARIYLDHNATAPLRPEARAAMAACMGAPANPSSAHREGAAARQWVEAARAEVAALVGARPAEIVFTSGATEANNLALRGLQRARGTILTTAIEHASVLATARALGAVQVVGVDAHGRLDRAALLQAAPGCTLASIGLANGEIGVVVPLAEIAPALRAQGLIVHTDAAQAAGRLPIDVTQLGVDALSLSSHKLGGPHGIGALWVRAGQGLTSQLTGGSQERDRRAGTENVLGIVGFGAAARVARIALATEQERLRALRDRLWDCLRTTVTDMHANGPTEEPRLANTLNLRFAGCSGESLLVRLDLDGVAVSLGSACAAGAAEPSHVLMALGLDRTAAQNGVRLSIGPSTTPAEIDDAAARIAQAVAAIRRRVAA